MTDCLSGRIDSIEFEDVMNGEILSHKNSCMLLLATNVVVIYLEAHTFSHIIFKPFNRQIIQFEFSPT